MQHVLDTIDKKILMLLQKNARISNADISRQINLAPSATLERVRRLEKNEYIKAYNAKLNPKKLGLDLVAFIQVKTSGGICTETCDILTNCEDILEVFSITGDDCILVKVRAENTIHLNQILRDKILSIEHVLDTKTIIALETFKEESIIYLK